MRILVTGVAGFIGSHLAESLLGAGHSVHGIDSFSPYYSVQAKRRNVEALVGSRGFEMVEASLLDADLVGLLRNTDVVFHLAAQPGVRKSWTDFGAYARDNILATQRLLEACTHSRITKFVFASSSSVYGDKARYPTDERAALDPISPYGVTKETAEKLCRVYQSAYSLPVVILRYFTVYGPRQRPDMGIYRFIDSILRKKQIQVFGDGKQWRDFTYVSDIVAGSIAAAERARPGSTLNLGGGRSVQLIRLLRIIGKAVGSEPELVFSPPAAGDVRKTAADISAARKKIGYRPKVELEAGIRNQIEWEAGIHDRASDLG